MTMDDKSGWKEVTVIKASAVGGLPSVCILSGGNL